MVRRYLQVLGEKVCHLTINFFAGSLDKSPRDAVVIQKLLSEWLRFVPNLKSLSLDAWLSRSSMETQEVWQNLFGNFSCPKFKDLITFQASHGSPQALIYPILKNSRRIKHIGLFTNFDAPLMTPNFLELDFPKLSTFKCYFYHLEDWEKFVKVPSWKLARLSLGCYGKTTELTATAFFEGIQKFENTLTSLTFNLNKERWTGPENQEASLNLPLLKRLHLVSHDWEPVSLESILKPLESENLEAFSLELSQNYDHSRFGEVGTLVNYVNNFPCRQSDWMKFPKLRNVKLTVLINDDEIGDPAFLEVRRSNNMSSVRYDVVEIDEFQIFYWDR